MLYVCGEGCQVEVGMSRERPGVCAPHGRSFYYAKSLGSNGRKPLRRVSEKRAAEEAEGKRPRRYASTLNQGNGFAVAPAQRAKVRDLACLVCGRDRHEASIEPAHVCARRLAPHCDCPDGVVPLCDECHGRYDDQNTSFDLLPALITHERRIEVVHAFLEHGVGLVDLLSHIAGERYLPASKYEEIFDQQRGRIAELERRVVA